MMPTEAQQLINPAAVLIGLTLAMGMRTSPRCIPPAAMSVGLTLALSPLVPMANKSLQRISHLMQLSLVQRGRRGLVALAKKLPSYIANELVTMLPNLALWLASSVVAASVLPATSFMVGIVAVSGPRLKSISHPVKTIYHGSGSVWVPVACLAVTALGDSWRLPLRRSIQAWYLKKTGRTVRAAPAMLEGSHASLDQARQAATFSLVTRAGLYYGLSKLVRLTWGPSRIVLRRALTLHPALPFSLDYWQMLEGFLALQYQLTALMQCFWYVMSVCARFALPAMGEHWGLMEAELLNHHEITLVDNTVDETLDDSDYFEASEGEGAGRLATINVAGPSRSAQVSSAASPSPTKNSASARQGAMVHAPSVRSHTASTSKQHRPAGSRVEVSASQRVALVAQRAASKAADDSMNTSSKTGRAFSSKASAGRFGMGVSALSTNGQASEVALGKKPDRFTLSSAEAHDRHRQAEPKPKTKGVKGKARETQPQDVAERERKEDESKGSKLGIFGGEEGTGSYCVIEESTLSLPVRGTKRVSKPELEEETEAKEERGAETVGAASEPTLEGLTSVSSSSSLPSSSTPSHSSSTSAAPTEPRSRRSRTDSSSARTPSASQSSQIRHIDSFMDLNLEYATLRGMPREINAAQQAAHSASISASGSTPASAAAAEIASESYDWEKRRYLQGARGSPRRSPQW